MNRRHQNNQNDFYSSHLNETENDGLVESLRGKVTQLKSISLDMGTEIREHNRYLAGMDQDFESVYGSLKNSMSRLTKIALSGGNRLYFYLILFSFFVFFVIYIIMKLR